MAFIVAHLYGWLLKWFYRPEAYSEHFHELFPAQRAVGLIYFLQIFELPYLLQVGDRDALLYANAFALLFFSFQMLVMCDLYFFPRDRQIITPDSCFSGARRLNLFWLALPSPIVLAPLFLQAVELVSLPNTFLIWNCVAVSVVFLFFLFLNIRMALRIDHTIQQVNEQTYADSDDFPVHFARYIRWIPTIICFLLAFNFLACDPWVKFVRDILFTFASAAFCIVTLNPKRKFFTAREEETLHELSNKPTEGAEWRLDSARSDELCRRLEQMLSEEHIFTEPHITSDILIQRLGINATYLTEVIRRSGYASFYDMVNQHRVRHAIALIRQHPDQLLSSISDQCGFSSQASMAKAFKSQGKPSPSTFRQLRIEN